MADYKEHIRQTLGADAVTKLCSEANSGRISVLKGKTFSRHLGETVCGNFMRERRDEVGQISRDEMEQMLSDFWQEEGVCQKGRDELLTIVGEALKKAQIPLVIKTSENDELLKEISESLKSAQIPPVIITSEEYAAPPATIKTVYRPRPRPRPRQTQYSFTVLSCCAGNSISASLEEVNEGFEESDEVDSSWGPRNRRGIGGRGGRRRAEPRERRAPDMFLPRFSTISFTEC